jgi:hypothetical protein
MFSLQGDTLLLSIAIISLHLAGLLYCLGAVLLFKAWRNTGAALSAVENRARKSLLPGAALILLIGLHLLEQPKTAWISLSILLLAQLLYLRRQYKRGIESADRVKKEKTHIRPVGRYLLLLSLALWLLSLLVGIS